jgi:DNA invertase Pin-like site-specific DNA recombinase
MQVGYGRVSSSEQRLDLQINALTEAGCDKIFTDTGSGAKADRPGLRQALEFCRTGDSLSVWRLDRLGRSLPDLLRIVQELDRREIAFRSLSESIDTQTIGGKLAFAIFGSIASFELAVLRERTNAGLAAARQRGRVGGRPRSMTDEKVEAARKLLADGTPPRDVARIVGVSVPTLYRYLPASRKAA